MKTVNDLIIRYINLVLDKLNYAKHNMQLWDGLKLKHRAERLKFSRFSGTKIWRLAHLQMDFYGLFFR